MSNLNYCSILFVLFTDSLGNVKRNHSLLVYKAKEKHSDKIKNLKPNTRWRGNSASFSWKEQNSVIRKMLFYVMCNFE